MHEFRQNRDLCRICWQTAFGMACCHTQAMIDRAKQSRGIAEECGVGRIKIAGCDDHLNALRRVERLVEIPRITKPQIHEDKIDVVIATSSGLKRIAHALLAFQTFAHMCEFFARAPALPITLPIDFLQLAQKHGAAIRIARDRPRLHVRDSLPCLGTVCKILPVRAFRLHQCAFASIRPQPGINREDDAVPCIGADHTDQTFGDGGPEENLRRIGVGNHEIQIGIRCQVKLPHAEPPERDHHHLIGGPVQRTGRRPGR